MMNGDTIIAREVHTGFNRKRKRCMGAPNDFLSDDVRSTVSVIQMYHFQSSVSERDPMGLKIDSSSSFDSLCESSIISSARFVMRMFPFIRICWQSESKPRGLLDCDLHIGVLNAGSARLPPTRTRETANDRVNISG